MKTKNVILICLTILSFSNSGSAQTNSTSKKYYTYAISASPDGNTIYISTVFCWNDNSGKPFVGSPTGFFQESNACDFLVAFAISTFNNNVPNFNGKNTTVNCSSTTPSLCGYGGGKANDFSDEDLMSSERNCQIDDYRNDKHKTVVIVNFPSCKE